MSNNTKSEIIEMLNKYPEFRNKLYCRGFLLTDAQPDEQAYPFYGQWQKKELQHGRVLLVHSAQKFYCKQGDGRELLLVGHAYDPFEMEWDENKILDRLFSEWEKDEKALLSAVNKLTGIFTFFWSDGDNICFLGDTTCEQTCYYTVQNGHIYVTTHSCLAEDFLDLTKDPYIAELVKYRFYPLLGNLLPGDLSKFKELKRVIPNHFVRIQNGNITVSRHFSPQDSRLSLQEVVSQSAQIMHNNMELIAKKWDKPAISLTGGCDSKTTLAAAHGLYDKFVYFSYISNESEEVDAEAAHNIAQKLGLEHKIYTIPENDGEVENFECIARILNRNFGEIGDSKRNDVRKRAFFADTSDFGVEVKSWASEIGRAEYIKRFNGRTKFGNSPTARKCTTLYKFFLHNRKLVKETDRVFAEFIEKYYDNTSENAVPWWEWFYWEYYQGAIGLKITGEHKYSFDITVPYNNRILLSIMLSAPLEDRIKDLIHIGIRNSLDPRIDDTGISVTNLKHTQNRARAENIYYTLHSKFPF